MIPSNNASTYSDEKLDNNEVTDDLNATDKGLFPEELQKKTILVLEKLDHIQNKIRKAEESILSESDKSCNLESKNEDFHRRTVHFDNHFDERIKTLTRHGNAIIWSSERGQDGLLQSISQLKTSLGKAKGATRAYLECRAKLLAIRRKSHCGEKIKKYEEIIFDILMLLKEIGSSLATIGLQSKTNVFLNYVHDKYESLFEAQKLDYKKRHETEIREYFENNGRTELDEHRDVNMSTEEHQYFRNIGKEDGLSSQALQRFVKEQIAEKRKYEEEQRQQEEERRRNSERRQQKAEKKKEEKKEEREERAKKTDMN
ncbi:putative autophagy-related protein 11 [Macrobrachium rosenbergii]|uniref:putative autophagy-related protein 11 n=1 Tax=Macrobrachium rosenbergii TaxID=79674 RepID=UPI0034D49D7E